MCQSSSAVLLLKLNSRTCSTVRNTVESQKEQQQQQQSNPKNPKTNPKKRTIKDLSFSPVFNDSEYAFCFPLCHLTYPKIFLVVLWKL